MQLPSLIIKLARVFDCLACKINILLTTFCNVTGLVSRAGADHPERPTGGRGTGEKGPIAV